MAPIKGLDILALAMQDAKMIAHEIAPDSALGFLVGTFGDYSRKLRTILNTGKVIAVRAHLTNGPCERNGNCDAKEPGPTDYKTIAKRAGKLHRLMMEYPHVELFISPRLEHDVRDQTVIKKWCDIIKHNAPTATVVISAYKGKTHKGCWVERHGNKAKGDIISNDGEELFDAPRTYCNGAKVIAFGWISACNCRVPGAKFVPPKKRTIRLTALEIRVMQEMMGMEHD